MIACWPFIAASCVLLVLLIALVVGTVLLGLEVRREKGKDDALSQRYRVGL